VVWFGESLPERAFLAASRAASACDLFLCVGTSASVYPAAAFPLLARRQGAYVVEVDQDVTSVSDLVDESIRGKATEIMPQLAAMARGSR
jgi:NAD-dependent deacetylase